MGQNTLLVNGTDLRALAGVIIASDMMLLAPGTRRSQSLVIPGRRGQVPLELPYDAYQFGVLVIIQGASRSDWLTKLVSLGAALAGTNGVVTLERRLDNGAGYDSYTAAGMYVAGTTTQLLNDQGQTELTFINTDGAWSPDFGTTWVVP